MTRRQQPPRGDDGPGGGFQNIHARKHNARRRAHQADTFAVIGEEFPLIPPGSYEAACVSWARVHLFTVSKLVFHYDVIVPDGDAADGHRLVRLPRWYGFRQLPDGRPTARASSNYWRDHVLITRRRPIRRRLPPSELVGALVRVQVVTVERDRENQPLSEFARYSKIGRILEVLNR